MTNEAQSTLLGSFTTRRGELVVAGQVAISTGYSGQRAMPTGSVGSPIGRGPLGSRTEAGMGSWTVRQVYGAPPRPDEASEEGADGAQMSC